MEKIEIDPNEEIIIQGKDVTFMVEALRELVNDFEILGISKKTNQKKAKSITIHMAAAIIGLIRMMPRKARKDSMMLFEKTTGIPLKKLEGFFNK